MFDTFWGILNGPLSSSLQALFNSGLKFDCSLLLPLTLWLTVKFTTLLDWLYIRKPLVCFSVFDFKWQSTLSPSGDNCAKSPKRSTELLLYSMFVLAVACLHLLSIQPNRPWPTNEYSSISKYYTFWRLLWSCRRAVPLRSLRLLCQLVV